MLLELADSDNVPDLSSQLTQMDAAIASGGFDTVDIDAAFTSALTALDAVDLGTYTASVSAARLALDDFDIAYVLSTLDSVEGGIDAVDLQQYEPTLLEVKQSLVDVRNQQQTVDDAANALSAVHGLLRDELPDYLARLHRQSLADLAAAQGPGAVLLEVARVGAAAVAYVRERQSLFDLPALDVDFVAEYTAYLDRAAATGVYESVVDYGSAYYFAQLALPEYIIPADDPNALYVLTGADGEPYADDRLCVTSDCISATVATIHTSNIKEVGSALPDGVYPAQIPDLALSREGIFVVLFVPLMVVVAFGMLAFVSRCLCTTPGWQKVPASWMTGCIVCQLPCIFLAMAICFPLVLLLGDVCASGPNVGYNFILSYGDDVCPLAMGTGTLQECNFRFQATDDIELEARLDIDAAYRGLMGGTCPETDPYAAVVLHVAEAIRELPYKQVAKFVGGDAASTLGVTLRPNVVEIAARAANSTGAIIYDFLADEAEASANCESLHSVVAGMKEAICCNVVTPIYWYVTAWFVAAWAMLLCGIPAGLLARKRLPANPWGPVYEDALSPPSLGSKQGSTVQLELRHVSTKRGATYDGSGDVDDGEFRVDGGASGGGAAGRASFIPTGSLASPPAASLATAASVSTSSASVASPHTPRSQVVAHMIAPGVAGGRALGGVSPYMVVPTVSSSGTPGAVTGRVGGLPVAGIHGRRTPAGSSMNAV